MMQGLGEIGNLALLPAGFLLIIIVGAVCIMRRDVSWTALVAFALSTFLVAAPVIETFKADKSGFAVVTVAKNVLELQKMEIEKRDNTAPLQDKLTKALDGLSTQVNFLIEKSSKGEISSRSDASSPQTQKELLERQNAIQSDIASATELAAKLAADNQKQQMERWKILQDTQAKILEIQQSQDKSYKKWDEYISRQ
jgi:hypothetical protein